eukprot:TRINITY_DN17042_c0_g1_i1.p1 TRINITY_DN17042_c0_g1~~TRINITY_DN17042_c0_g1_i1.p1  ORF type:complete len:202 (+),score=77.19 TRINITY_DN17042_c0_g1_i1:88-693(+)
MFVLFALTFIAYAVGLLFVCVCLAQGLYFIAELVEEHTMIAKRILKYAITTVIVLHVLLFFFEELPTMELAVSFLAHIVYSWLLVRFPVVDLFSPQFILSTMMAVGSHCLWFKHFLFTWYSYTEMMAIFLVCVWLVPFCFFVSLSANEATLPYQSPTGTTPARGKHVQLFLLLMRPLERFFPWMQSQRHAWESDEAQKYAN